MSPRLKLSSCVIERFNQVKTPCVGFIYGAIHKGEVFVLSFSVENHYTASKKVNEKTRRISGSQATGSKNEVVGLNFPTEVDVVGVVRWYEGNIEDGVDSKITSLLEEVSVTDNPILLKYKIDDPNSLKAECVISEVFTEKSFEVFTESELVESFILVRLKASLRLDAELSTAQVKNSMELLQRKLSSGASAFYFPKPSIFLTSSDAETGLKGPGVSGEDMTLKDLYNACFDTSSKKKKKASRDFDVLPVQLMIRPTRERFSLEKYACAPVIQHQKGNFKCLQMVLPVDALSLVHRDTKAPLLYSILVESLCNHLRVSKECVLSQIQSEPDRIRLKCPSQPIPYHFLPSPCGHFITLLYPKDLKDTDLESERKKLHTHLALPGNVPLFRRSNQYVFRDELPPNSPLVNPHDSLAPSGVQGGDESLVQGFYSYHHYMQDNINDNGWGCAYRSLQTIISWFRFQGYTDKPIPSHQQIQKCLVDLGDKPSSFIGTKQWIGSTEVGFVLDSMLGVSSRIISVSSGEELEAKGRELAYHFKTQGTPIMIGGGVLAHTILGVHFNSDTGELKFLILDPHYTGGEDLGVIQSKGWCGWKGTNFWVKTAYYNLCLPQRPLCI
ncbi:ufm1-specific protease 2 [Ischnura elegans]|uniref:ufm1-specific protease 2 n=1 Tax=Ischnura elegans TaxID=197161 RepID=UPI001ED8B536|nr:ufm1-specific protease 2 [Ischnura elegans]